MKSADHAHSPKKSRRAFVSLSQCVQCVKRHSNVYLPHSRLIVGAASRTRPYPAPAAVAWWRHEKEKSWEWFLFAKVAQTTLWRDQTSNPELFRDSMRVLGCANISRIPGFFRKFLTVKKFPKLFQVKKIFFLKTKNLFSSNFYTAWQSRHQKEGSNETWSRFSELQEWWSLSGSVSKSCAAHTTANWSIYGMNEALLLLSLNSVLPERSLARTNYRFDLSSQHTP